MHWNTIILTEVFDIPSQILMQIDGSYVPKLNCCQFDIYIIFIWSF